MKNKIIACLAVLGLLCALMVVTKQKKDSEALLVRAENIIKISESREAVIRELSGQVGQPKFGMEKIRPLGLLAWSTVLPRTIELTNAAHLQEYQDGTLSRVRPLGCKFYRNGLDYTVITGTRVQIPGADECRPCLVVYVASKEGSLSRWDVASNQTSLYYQNQWHVSAEGQTFSEFFDLWLKAITEEFQSSVM